MDANWKEFELGPARRGSLHVTLDAKGNILIGAVAFRQMGSPLAAVLLFDKGKRLIGIRPVPPETYNAFPMLAMTWGRHRVIRANRFMRHHGIRVSKRMAFTESRVNDSMLILDLNCLQHLNWCIDKENETKNDGSR